MNNLKKQQGTERQGQGYGDYLKFISNVFVLWILMRECQM